MKGIVAAGHAQTAEAAEQILRAGGNAFDAMLAAAWASCVAEPVLASLCGGGFLLARPASGRSLLFDCFVQTPARRRPEAEIDFREVVVDFGTTQQEFHMGWGSVATPGLVRGLFEIHRRLGTMPMCEIAAPAQEYARRGIHLDPLQAYIFDVVGAIYTATPESREIFGSSENPNRTKSAGEVIRQPLLADLIESLAVEGDDLFYRGEVGAKLAECCLAHGGHLRRSDLESYAVELREPFTMSYRGHRLLTNPPPSSGGILIGFALRLLEAIDSWGKHTFGSFRHLALLARTMQLTNHARLDALADDSRGCPDADRLLDAEWFERYRKEIVGRAAALRGTTHISIIDSDDNTAALTMSNGEGCGSLIPGTGIMPNNMLGEEDINPAGFHRWPPGHRMTSMMAPTVVELSDGRVIATGSGGSNRIRTTILQVLVNLIDQGMSVDDAVHAPRIHFERGELGVENGFPHSEVERLLEIYPNHHLWDGLNLFFGGAHTVEHSPAGFRGAGDPRRGGVCRELS